MAVTYADVVQGRAKGKSKILLIRGSYYKLNTLANGLALRADRSHELFQHTAESSPLFVSSVLCEIVGYIYTSCSRCRLDVDRELRSLAYLPEKRRQVLEQLNLLRFHDCLHEPINRREQMIIAVEKEGTITEHRRVIVNIDTFHHRRKMF